MRKNGFTDRGFGVIRFNDAYGAKSSLQESSLARIENESGDISDGHIWFGVDRDLDGKYVEYGRMHLTQTQMRELLPLLEHFVEFGVLPKEETPEDVTEEILENKPESNRP